MSAHTPGPWSSRGTLGPWHEPHLKGPCVVEVAATGWQLAILSGWRTETQRADARLMAAAPTMYEYIASSAANGCAEARKIMEAINPCS